MEAGIGASQAGLFLERAQACQEGRDVGACLVVRIKLEDDLFQAVSVEWQSVHKGGAQVGLEYRRVRHVLF